MTRRPTHPDCILLAALMLLVMVSPCAAQGPKAGTILKTWSMPPGEPVPYGRRTDAFRRLLYELRFQPLDGFERLKDDPAKTVLIVFGDPSCLRKDIYPGGLRAFVQTGGAVLIATDNAVLGEAGASLKELAGVRVMGETLVCLSPVHVYDDQIYCPFVQSISDSRDLGRSTSVLGALAAVMGAGGRPDLFRNPRSGELELHVATNAPSRLELTGWWLPSGIHRLARLPVYCQEEGFAFGFSRRRSPRPAGPRRGFPRSLEMRRDPEQTEAPLFAVGGTVGEGRVLVLADHSIFINRMILPRDIGNLEFTANALHWLRGGSVSSVDVLKAANNPKGLQQLGGQRDRALFWDDGEIRTKFDVPLKTIPINPLNPPPGSEPAIVAALDGALARMEDSNALNQGLLEEIDDLPWTPRRLGRNGLYLLTFALVLLLGYWFGWRGRYRLDAAVPLLARAVAQNVPKTHLLEQRRRAVLGIGNVWETAHRLARQCFESAGVALTDAAPSIVVQGSWWRRWRVSRRIRRLWQLARGTTPGRVSPAALQLRLRELEELRIALANGTIQLQSAIGHRLSAIGQSRSG